MRTEQEIRKVRDQMKSVRSPDSFDPEEVRGAAINRLLIEAFDWVLGSDTPTFNDRTLELLADAGKE